MPLRLAVNSRGQSSFCCEQSLLDARVIDVAPSHSGIDFIHTDGSSGKRYMVGTVIGSLAIFDYVNDGWLDIYFVNGAPLLGLEKRACTWSPSLS